MTILDQQLHGYRNGHQLLSSSAKLSKTDQDLVDRLSDVAGPLRPGEHFEPYLTCYPLPSGSYYVIARTWQDLDAPRAGCVRTRSYFIPMLDWTSSVDVLALARSLTHEGPTAPAKRVHLARETGTFAPVDAAQCIELVEALFLEDRKPIVVFDASKPEGITLRLLTALWPSLRTRFAVSTFALSPRSIGSISFDLVFAPKDARSRFSDWPGRRIDGRNSAEGRHRWSRKIVQSVFQDQPPVLLSDDVLGELSTAQGGTEADLRISLLWNELYDKLEVSPNAALGLLDIANSRSPRNIKAIKRLEPELGHAAIRAAESLPSTDAWRFLLALTEKLNGVRLKLSSAKAIRNAAMKLATKSPSEAIRSVEMLANGRGRKLLIGAIGDGLAQRFDTDVAEGIAALQPANVLQLLLLSSPLSKVALKEFPSLSEPLAAAIADASKSTRDLATRRILKYLVEELYAPAARPLIAELDEEELLAETSLLFEANRLAAESLHRPLAERAKEIGALSPLRTLTVSFPESAGADALLTHLIAPVREDLEWVMTHSLITDQRRLHYVCRLLQSASLSQLKSMVGGVNETDVFDLLMKDPGGNVDTVKRILDANVLSASLTIDMTLRLLPYAGGDDVARLASRAVEVVLGREAGEVDSAALELLLQTAGDCLDGRRAIFVGLNRKASAKVFASHLSAFNRSSSEVRQRIMSAIPELATAIIARGRIDYPESAVSDAANLLWDSGTRYQRGFLDASAALMPFLLQARHDPVSPLIAAAFPPVYKLLMKDNNAPDFLKFFLFVDWDKCKTARHHLVDAFMHSNWRATDIALAAARAGDLDKILHRIAEQAGGGQRILEIKRDLLLIPDPWSNQIRGALRFLTRDDSFPDGPSF